jgi:uncharacterized protein YgiM (DUF1202 family)
MLRASRNCASIDFLLLGFLIFNPSVGAAEQKAAVFGTPTANVRAGAGVEHALKTTLKEGDLVVVEKLEGEWYLVNAVDGQKGYVHKNLLKLAADATPQSIPAQPAAPAPNAPQAKAPLKDAAVVPAPAPAARQAPALQTKPAEAKSQSILQMLEGREAELKIGLFIAGVAFVIGWFCGGSFYQRRERKSRYKLRF